MSENKRVVDQLLDLLEDRDNASQIPIESFLSSITNKNIKNELESKQHLPIIEPYKILLSENKKLPFSFNVVREIHSNENDHSRILCKLLQYDPNGKGAYPLAFSFVEKIISPEIINAWHNSKEKLQIVFNRNFIDLAIWKKGTSGVIIENKIQDATDQEKQLEKYSTDMLKKKQYNCKPYAVYLTWNGVKEVSDMSLTITAKKNLSDNSAKCSNPAQLDLNRFFRRNYVYDVLPWLKEDVLPCMPYREKYLISGLEQYIDYLEARASMRPVDLAKNKAVYEAIQNEY